MALTKQERHMLECVRAAVQPALDKVAADYGLQSLRLGNVVLNREAGTFTSKVTGTVQGAAGKEGLEYDSLQAYSYSNLPDRGKPTTGKAGIAVVAVGATSRRPRKIIFTKPDGKRYVAPVAHFIMAHCTLPEMRPSERAMFAASLATAEDGT